ncbi:MAG: rRNA pseudouridine synthase [Epulopiscium sp.]|nr:rRNA pseudouridine synthase [Candidatus Epulonipiscium sp.]
MNEMTMKKYRVDKILASLGIGSRKEVKKYIRDGWLTVDGIIIQDPGFIVNPAVSELYFQNQKLDYQQFRYYMLNKPSGVISATEDRYDQTVIDLLDLEDRLNIFPVGRLDKDTEGLLILTNDGKLAHNLLSPKKKVPKTYYAKIQGRVNEEDGEAFQAGIILDDGYKTLPAELTILSSGEVSEIELTIYEGKFHQVKRMFISRNKEVLYLKRISMGELRLDLDLALGSYRPLTNEEIQKLKQSAGNLE